MNNDIVEGVEEGRVLCCTCSKDETIVIFDGVTGEVLCKHCEDSCGMWTSIAAPVNDSDSGGLKVALVGTTFKGEVYAFSCKFVDSGLVELKCLKKLTKQADEVDDDDAEEYR